MIGFYPKPDRVLIFDKDDAKATAEALIRGLGEIERQLETLTNPDGKIPTKHVREVDDLNEAREWLRALKSALTE